jgi:predicted Zn finger-like uncharacterized protein
MLIVCPTCATSYQIEPAALGADGRSVRCSRCRTVWFTAGALEPDGDWPQNRDESAADEAGWTEAASTVIEHSPEPADGAPPLAPTLDGMAPIGTVGVGEDIDSFAARRARRLELMRRRRWQPNLVAIILTLLIVNAALIGWRTEIVRLLPQTASLFAAIGLSVNLRGLRFDNVTTARDLQEDVTVLVVEGIIANTTVAPVEVPRLRLAVRNGSGSEIYTWTALPDRSILGPGETQPFRSRLASPPADGRDVVVRFFHRTDLVSAGR